MQPDVIDQFDTSSLSGNFAQDIVDQLMPLFIISIIVTLLLTVPFIIIYILGAIRKHKAQTAIFDIQQTLHEMNERDKARTAPPTAAITPAEPRAQHPERHA